MKFGKHLAMAAVVALAGGLGAAPADYAAVATTSSSWTVQYPPDPAKANSDLVGVSCSSARACIAVGYSANDSSGRIATLAERWNGAGWAIQSTPDPRGSTSNSLNGVSCPSATVCVAVGDHYSSSQQNVTLAEYWNGRKWAIQATPSPRGAYGPNGVLNAVSCSSARACTAVGYYYDLDGSTGALVERWNGSKWAIQATPHPNGSTGRSLAGVSCPSARDCVAVGPGTVSGGATLAEHWNGTKWKVQRTPNPFGAKTANLFGVSCSSATACTATGSYENGLDTYLTLAERWNGRNWVRESIPSPHAGSYSNLDGVSCSSRDACTAIGIGDSRTLAEHWNGSKWAIQLTPNPQGGGSMGGVSCSSATACTAAGRYLSKSLLSYATLAMRYS